MPFSSVIHQGMRFYVISTSFSVRYRKPIKSPNCHFILPSVVSTPLMDVSRKIGLEYATKLYVFLQGKRLSWIWGRRSLTFRSIFVTHPPKETICTSVLRKRWNLFQTIQISAPTGILIQRYDLISCNP